MAYLSFRDGGDNDFVSLETLGAGEDLEGWPYSRSLTECFPTR